MGKEKKGEKREKQSENNTVILSVDQKTKDSFDSATNENVTRQLESLKSWREQSLRCGFLI